MERISVIMPVHNGGTDLETCLAAVSRSSWPIHECIVVDDSSSDNGTERLAKMPDVHLIRLKTRCGPAVARNAGAARAEGGILLFVDADVVIHPDAIAIAAKQLADDPELAAVFGSYDDHPFCTDFVSRYRNLFHHWVHQSGNTESASFWSGFGAIRRSVFMKLGGFNPTYTLPSIEDIELGTRLNQAGYRVRLEKLMLCTHLKRWSLLSVFSTDLFRRGVPWIRLLLKQRSVPSDLNLKLNARLATLFASLICLVVPVMLLSGHGDGLWPAAGFLISAAACSALNRWEPGSSIKTMVAAPLVAVSTIAGFSLASGPSGLIPLVLILALILTHLRFYRFLTRRHGISFALAAIPMQLSFFLTCAMSIPLGLAAHLLRAGEGPAVR